MLVFAILLTLASVSAVAGVFLILGVGPALLALAAVLGGWAWIVRRGLG